MKDLKTTIAGALLAVLIAVEPLISGAGYHFDKQTIVKVTIAGLVACATYFAKDSDAKN